MNSPAWTFLSNHGHVLVCLALDPDARMREVAGRVGITERAVQAIVADLVAAGHLDRRRQGRRNHYRVRRDSRFRHPLEARVRVGDFLNLVTADGAESALTPPGRGGTQSPGSAPS